MIVVLIIGEGETGVNEVTCCMGGDGIRVSMMRFVVKACIEVMC